LVEEISEKGLPSERQKTAEIDLGIRGGLDFPLARAQRAWLAFRADALLRGFMGASPFSMTGQQPLEGFLVLLSNSKENSGTHFNISIFH
jgi:hypothetical protein